MAAVINNLLRINGPLTFDTVGARFNEHREAFASGGDAITVDLAGVGRVDSAGLALLLEWQAMTRQSGIILDILNAPADLVRLAALCEASDLLGLRAKG